MSWPQTFGINSTGIGQNGTLPSLLAWGTTGIFNGVIVISIRSTPMIDEEKIMQGGGLTANQILINDGDSVEITVQDDRAVTWPLTGTPITVINPQPNGTAGTSETFQTINNNYSVSAKQNGQRTILAKRYTLITPVQM